MISEPEGQSKLIFSYPCRNKDLFNIAAIFSDKRDQDSVGKVSVSAKLCVEGFQFERCLKS